MTKITDYASLSAAVIDHTTREDLATPMPRFVQMAEQAMKRRLRSLDLEKTTIETVTGTELTLPADFLSLKSIQVRDDLERPMTAAGSFVTFDERSSVNNTYRISGDILTIGGLWFDPIEPIDILLTYVAKFTPLAVGTTNWLIEEHPDVYFYGTLAQAYGHYRDMEGMAVAESAFRNALEEVATSRNRDRYGNGLVAAQVVRQVNRGRC